MPPDRNRNGPGNKIPEKLPLLKLSAQGQIIFPDGILPLSFNDSQIHPDYRGTFYQKPYLILAMTAPGGSLYDIAVLGKIIPEETEGRKNLVNFMGLCRVNYQIVEGGREGKIARWYPLHKLPIPPEILSDPEFLAAVSDLKELFAAFIVQLKEEFGEDAAEFFSQEYIQKMLLVVQNTTLENEKPALAVDRIVNNILNFLNRATVLETFMAKKTIYWIPSLIILKDNDPLVRLEVTTEVLNNLSRVLRGESMIEQDEENLPLDPSNSPAENRQEPQRAPEALSVKTNQDGRAILQEQLRKPFEVKPRFPLPRRAGKQPSNLITLDWRTPSNFMRQVISFLDQHIVGQPRAKLHIAKKLILLREGLTDPRRPVVGLFSAGPTAVGKTETVKVVAKFLFDDFNGYTHVPCNIFHDKHEVSLVVGAPPGYIGYGEEPMLSQWRVDSPHFKKQVLEQHTTEIKQREQEIQELEDNLRQSVTGEERKKILTQLKPKYAWLKKIFSRAGYVPGKCFSIILWDEIERAPAQFFNMLLQVLDDGRFQLMNGEVTDLRHSMFFFTSNIYGTEIQKELSGKKAVGIRLPNGISMKQEFGQRIWRETINEIEKFFAINPAFLSRVGKENIEIFYPLEREELLEMMDYIYFQEFLGRLKERKGIEDLFLTEEAKEFIVAEAQDPTNRSLGARAMHKVFERLVEQPISILCSKNAAEEGIVSGDRIWIDARLKLGGSKEIVISKEPRSSL